MSAAATDRAATILVVDDDRKIVELVTLYF